FGSDQVVLHDKEKMTIIYKVLDFSALRKKDLNSNVIYLLQQKLADEKLKELQHDLEHLIQEPFSLQARAKSLYRTIQQSGVKIPINKDQRIEFFKDLRANLRSQTGQKDHIRNGLIRAKPYREFLLSYFQERKLPSELIAIPFLESSFNPRAHSKANALGVWQFMPFVASHFFPKRTSHMDYR